MSGPVSETSPRPPQVTAAGWMVVVGSVLVVLMAWQTVSSLHSIDTRNAIEEFLKEPPGNGMGVGVEDVRRIMHVSAMVAAASAVACAILGWFALKRDTTARLVLTLLAPVVFLTGMVTGGLMSAFVAAASLMLWLSPSREWFKGEPLRSARVDQPASPTEAGPQLGDPGNPFGGRAAPLTPGAVTDGEPRHNWPAPPTNPYLPGQFADGPMAPQEVRPTAAVAASVVTIVTCGLMALLGALVVVAVLAAPDLMMQEIMRQQPELAEQGLTTRLLQTSMTTVGVLFALWSLAAILMAALVLRRNRIAHVLLLVSAGLTGALCLFSLAMGQVAAVVPGAAALVVVVLLSRGDVRRWLAGRPHAGGVHPPR